MKLPYNIQIMVGNRNLSIDNVGMSNAKVICFDDMVLKIENQSEESNNEHRMMEWLKDKLPVPKILCSEKVDNKNYLLMSKVNGKMLCEKEFLENPNTLVKILAKGLKTLWKVDITNCPYNNFIDNKLRLAEMRVLNNEFNIEDMELETYYGTKFDSPSHILEWLKDNKPIDELVFSHGDYCLPNIFSEDGEISGFIDLGRSGIADKYHMCLICERISMIKEGTNKYFVKELETGYVVIGNHQYFKGYTLFLRKEHKTELSMLDRDYKLKFLEEMSIVAEAVQKATRAQKMNYEMLGIS